MRLIFSARARQELMATQRRIAKDSPEAAQKLRDRLAKAIEQLTQFAGMGRPGRIAGTRELVVPGTRYVVPYRVREDTVEIIAVYHSTQKWPDTF